MQEKTDRGTLVAELAQSLQVAELHVRVFGNDFGLAQVPEYVERISGELTLTQRVELVRKLARAAYEVWFMRWRFRPLGTQNDAGPQALQDLCSGLSAICVPATFHNLVPIYGPLERGAYGAVFGSMTLVEVASRSLPEIQVMFQNGSDLAASRRMFKDYYAEVAAFGFNIHDPSRDAVLVRDVPPE